MQCNKAFKLMLCRTVLNKKNPFKEKAMFKIDSGAIFMNSITNNKQKFKYSFILKEELGSISGKIQCKGNYRLELLDDNYKVIKSVVNPNEYQFENLYPKNYKLRIKIDLNNNGVWDEGSLKKRKNPEKIVFHKGDINLRKNWEIKDINISCKTKK